MKQMINSKSENRNKLKDKPMLQDGWKTYRNKLKNNPDSKMKWKA